MNNNCTAIGRLTKDLELRYTNSNKAVVELPMALNNGKTSDGKEDTTFLTITVFGVQAENCAKYCKKGDLVGANFMIKNHNWTDKEGNKHYDYSFIANRVTFLSTKKDGQTSEQKEVKQDNTYDPFQDEYSKFGESIDINNNDFLD